ncbi:MAG: SIMPL domain-containing protein, partial [Steroidobacteraceae bacterium]
IDPKLVRSTRINVQPEYNWNPQANERTLIGYFVSRQVEVELHDLEKLGQLLERATDLGVNQMGDPRLDSSKRHELEREALAKAVEDAKLNAEAVAKAAGAKLGGARTISASSGFVAPPMPMQMKAMAARAGDASESYQSGQMNFTGNVQIEYDLVIANP